MPAFVLAASRPITPPSSPSAMGVAKFRTSVAIKNCRAAMTKAPDSPRTIQDKRSEGGSPGSPMIFPAAKKRMVNHNWVMHARMQTRMNFAR